MDKQEKKSYDGEEDLREAVLELLDIDITKAVFSLDFGNKFLSLKSESQKTYVAEIMNLSDEDFDHYLNGLHNVLDTHTAVFDSNAKVIINTGDSSFFGRLFLLPLVIFDYLFKT